MNDLGPLSERELEVLKLVATGATNQQIARALVISPNTVKVHLRNIFEKLEVQSRTEATMEAIRRGLVPVEGAVLAGETATFLSPPVERPQPVVVNLPGPGARRILAPWQRFYLLAALAVVLAVALAPIWWAHRGQTSAVSLFSDLGLPQVTLPPRAEVTRWKSGAPLPVPRSRLALAADATRIYAIGGETANGVTGQVDIYNPQTNSWQTGARKLTPVANVAAVVLNDRIYVPGGTTAGGDVTNVLEMYDPQTDTWSPRALLPTPIAAYGLAALDGKLYLFGGWDGQQYRAETYIYDPATDTWRTGTPLPTPRAFLAAAAAENLLYVVGGFDGRQELAEVLAYDPHAQEGLNSAWRLRAPLERPRAGHGLANVAWRLYAIGGGWRESLAYNEQYDVRLDAWSRLGSPVVGQWRNLGLVAYEQRLYAVGGWGGTYLDVNEQYQALIRLLLPLGASGK
ncbi:MAG: Kelch repeat-containing protein [Anaerolineae bacterium]